MIDIAITDDHSIVIEGIRTMLKPSKDLNVLQSFHTIADALSQLDASVKVLLLDINLPDGNGVTACKEILKKFPSLKIIALTNLEDTVFVKQIIKNGASGYLLKNTDRNEIASAIATVLAGDRYLPTKIREQLLNESLGKVESQYFVPKLTSREKEVLQLIVDECTTDEIAEKLFLSVKTVESHRSNLIQKLGVKNSAGLVRVAFEKGLL